MQRLSDLNRLIYITFSDSLTYPNPTCKIFSKIPASTIRVGGLGALDSVGIDTLLWSAGEMDVGAAGGGGGRHVRHGNCFIHAAYDGQPGQLIGGLYHISKFSRPDAVLRCKKQDELTI